MGRPLTDKWIGRSAGSRIVLMPICNIGGRIGPCWILGQVGASKYVVQNADDPSVKGQIRLTNGTVSDPGTGYLQWETSHASGYVKSITDRKLKTYHGATVEWCMDVPTDIVACVISNSRNQ